MTSAAGAAQDLRRRANRAWQSSLSAPHMVILHRAWCVLRRWQEVRMMPFRHILAPTDFGESSLRAMRVGTPVYLSHPE